MGSSTIQPACGQSPATEDASPLAAAFFSVAASVLFLLRRMRRRHKQMMHLAPIEDKTCQV